MHRSARRPLALLAALVLAVLLTPTSAPTRAASSEPGATASPAAVKVTMNRSASAGRVVSKRAACERGRGVTVMAFDGMNVFYLGDDVTDRQGRWTLPTTSRRAGPKAVALVPGDTHCAPAQSRYVTLLERAGKAKRTISLKGGGSNPNGRVTSSSAACERGVDVIVFGRNLGPGEPWQGGGTTTTDSQGRYDFLGRRPAGVRGTDYQLTTLVVGTKSCRLAQSPIMTVRTR